MHIKTIMAFIALFDHLKVFPCYLSPINREEDDDEEEDEEEEEEMGEEDNASSLESLDQPPTRMMRTINRFASLIYSATVSFNVGITKNTIQ